jgi:serine/threonine protein kinase
MEFKCLLIFLTEGKFPFRDFTEKQLEKSILSNEPCDFEKKVSKDWKDFILSMLKKDQSLRPTIEQLYNHSLLTNFKESQYSTVPKMDESKLNFDLNPQSTNLDTFANHL